MFAQSIQEYEAKSAFSRSNSNQGREPRASAKPSPQSSFRQDTISGKTSPPSSQKALTPSTASALNQCKDSTGIFGFHGAKSQTPVPRGVGLEKLFEKGVPPQANRVVSRTSNQASAPAKKSVMCDAVYFDENDFDDDLDLELAVENPNSKGTIAPSRPSQPTARPEPHLSSNGRSTQGPPSSNGVPLPWSSSPLEHREHTLGGKRSLTSDAHKNSALAEAVQVPVEDPNPRPKKRRTLPWLDEASNQSRAQDEISNRSWPPRGAPAGSVTPLPKNGEAKYPWEKTASAFKAEQKNFREEKKRLVRTNARGTEDSQDFVKPISSNLTSDVQPIFLSEEQKKVLNLVIKQGGSVFFTGSAGTGKSVLLREIIKEARNKFKREPDRVAVTASTGLAACNIGGVTLHSFSGIGLGKETVSQLLKKIKRNPKAKTRWMRTKMLVIDEISMVDAELFDKLEGIARAIRGDGRAFGGIQLVLTGDFFQLPPVPDSGKVARFAFDASTWSTSLAHTIGLTQVFRQSDPVFAGMLNEMRVGNMNPKSINTFHSLSRPIQYSDGLDATELFPTRAEVEHANNARMRSLPGQSMIFHARDGGKIEDQQQRDKILANCMAPITIELKKDAQVMLIKNTDGSLVNGSLGKVVGFMSEKQFDDYNLRALPPNERQDQERQDLEDDDDAPMFLKKATRRPPTTDLLADTAARWPLVKFALPDGTTRELLVQPEMWKIELPNGEVQASRSQIPVILAWALSIHKAQGQTLARVKVDLGKVFEKGQAYVALSRATCQEGLQVLRFDPRKVLAHERVRGFYNSLYSAAEAARSARRGTGDDIEQEALEEFERSRAGRWDLD